MKRATVSSGSLKKATALLVTAGFLGWSATQVAGLIWHVMAPDSQLSASALVADNTFVRINPVSADNVDLARLQSVFVLSPGGAFSASALTADTAISAQDTRLALTLKGVVASSDATRSRAIIASAETQDVYRPGDSLRNTPGTVVIQAIHPSYVLLDNNGQIETLRMDEPEPSAVASVADVPARSEAVVVPATAGNNTAAVFAGSALTDLLRIQPVFEPADSARAGALRGLQIRHGSRQDFLAAVGLQQGDLITAVDGEVLDSQADLPVLMARFASLSSSTNSSPAASVLLQVLRDDTPVTVALDSSRW